jgi:hypothetical protein
MTRLNKNFSPTENYEADTFNTLDYKATTTTTKWSDSTGKFEIGRKLCVN